MQAGTDDSQWIDRRMALAREWDELVEQVRQIDGFADFLRPPPLATLLEAAANGPVVVVNVSRWRCDALVVTTAGVEVVPLSGLTADDVRDRTGAYLEALAEPTLSGLTYTEAIAAYTTARDQRLATLKSTMEWLWDVVAEPVLNALGMAEPQTKGPRVWWCPTGLLTLLPLHGAGYHDDGSGRTVLDRVVSSYTPTLRALAEAMRPRAEIADRVDGLLFVGVPDVPDQVQLVEEVERERDFLRARFPGPVAVIESRDATVDAVQTALGRHRWVHVSCHGYQDLNDPSAAGLVLTDGTLTITRLSAARYGGEFAFLSACRTHTGGVNLPDEVITLAAALSYTGYQHVVATLWSIDPAVAAEVTEAVYPELVNDDGFHPEQAASALHTAVRGLRAAGRALDDWLPFTHNGP